ncbi:MAG: FAD-binding protein [Actinocrinis sp.]
MAASTTPTNWAGNVAFGAARLHRPQSLAELRGIVKTADKVRVLGTGHSFNRIADTPADLVSVAGLPRVVEIDTANATAQVSAGLRYAEAAEQLHRAGYALANLASLPHISIAGACATGTHGSGDGNGPLASAVSGVRMVGSGGETVELFRAHDPERFAGAVVNLGALGVVTSVTLDLLPTFDVAQYVYEGLSLELLAEDFTAVFGAAYSVSVFTDWADGSGRIWVKQRLDAQTDASSGSAAPARPAQWLGARLADGPRHPVPGMSTQSCTEQGGVPGPWHERLPHFRPEFTPSAGEELQSEFLLPRAAAPQAIAALLALGERIAPVLLTSEIRTIAADEQWLSPAYGRDSVAFHFTWVKQPEAVAPVLAEIEGALMPLGGRPHWGKVFSVPSSQLAGLYEHAGDFTALAAELDPAGKFRNRYVADVFPALG